MSYEMLFSPMKIGSLEIKNRIVMNAAEFSLGQINGCPTERLMDYYEERAKGGVGLIMPGITRVNDMGAASTFTQLSMSSDRHIEPMRELVRRIHRHGAKFAVQLHHPGRQGYASAINSLPLITPIAEKIPKLPNVLFKATPLLLAMEQKKLCFSLQAPSKCELSAHGATRVHAMSKREIHNLVNDFIDAAERCKKAGVDAVELHSTHGYILQQFLSPNTNKRTDEYGGSFDNRMRFITEIILGIKSRCGSDYPLIVRLSADEMYDRIGLPGKGYDLSEGKKMAKRLEELGVDAIDVSCACYDTYNYWLEPTTFEPGWRAYLAKEIKNTVKIPVIAANLIRSPEQAERQLKEGYQDFVGSARNFICDPHWAKKAQEGRAEDIRRCIGCLNCIKSFIENAEVGKPGECALNMSVGIEKEYYNVKNTGSGKKIVVIGAGPAGLTAAVTLQRRGFNVTVLEKHEKAGGQVKTASAGNLKEKLYWCIEDLLHEAKQLGVEIKTGFTATAENVSAMNPYAVILATGGSPIRPRSIRGIDNDNVFTAPDILNGKVKIENKKVVVIGSGLTGLETTETLNDFGNTVTVVDAAAEIAPGAWFQFVDDSLSRIKPCGTEFILSHSLTEINSGGIVLKNVKTGQEKPVSADCVVLAMGVRPERGLFVELKAKNLRVLAVGDAEKGGTIASACHSAFNAAMTL
ncbi:MAG: FAD-dependent oxidoreductase [Oscillospiraceae bacterium]|nr:FAD-dependent oxidoreductase [Oscillospiraceae bacterium]